MDLFFTFGLACFGQNADDLSQGKKRLVDIDTFLCKPSFSPSHADSFRACQINKFQLTEKGLAGIIIHKALNSDTHDGMASGRLHVESMGRADSVFESVEKEFHEFLLIFAFEYKKVFDTELLIFVPSEPESVDVGWEIFVIEGGRVEKIEDFFVVDLEERDWDGEGAFLWWGLYFSEEVLDDSGDDTIDVDIGAVFDGLRALHGVGFSGAGLSIGEDCAVVAFESFVDHGLDLALFVKVWLGGVGIEEVVEVEFSESVGLLSDVDFVFIFVDFDEGVFEGLFFLWR